MNEGPVLGKTLIVQVMEKYSEQIKKTQKFIKKERVYGEITLKLKEVFEQS